MGRLAATEQVEIWRRYRLGASLPSISRSLGYASNRAYEFMLTTGGLVPRVARRSSLRLSAAEREEISRGVTAGDSCRVIARRISRAPSTVSRELTANGGRERYRATAAEAAADRRARRPKLAKLRSSPRLRQAVSDKLMLRWSPQQIAGWLPLAYPEDKEMRVSHETIYVSLFVQTRGALRKELAQYLRTHRQLRRSCSARSLGG